MSGKCTRCGGDHRATDCAVTGEGLEVIDLGKRLGACSESWDRLKAERDALAEQVRSLTVERDRETKRAESAEGELDDLSTLVHYDGGDSRSHLGECFSSVMDQWRYGRAAFKALRAAMTPKAEAQAICDLYGALFPDESDEDAPTEPDYDEEVDRLAEAPALRARLSRAREALDSAEGVCGICARKLAALRAALSEPPAG